MATKIFYNDNRIIIDGHADTAQECQAITAMCDELANSENFKTIIYENGHAVFERVSGGENEVFLVGIQQCECKLDEYLKSAEAKGIYLSQTDAASIYASKTLLNDKIDELKHMIGTIDPSIEGSLKQQLNTLNTTVENIRSEFERSIKMLMENELILGQDLEAFKAKISKPLPFTADELIAKLASI